MSELAKKTTKRPESKSSNIISKAQKSDYAQSISSPIDRILNLQRTIGNRAVQRLLSVGVIQQSSAKQTPSTLTPQGSLFRKHHAADQLSRTPRISAVNFNVVGYPFLSLKSKDLCKTKYDVTKYVKANVMSGDGNMTDVVTRLIKAKTITVTGRRDLYAKEMQKYNYKLGAMMHVGDCLLMQKAWIDPNIGSLPSLKTIKPSLKAKIIATIYAEQTQDQPEQHRYIWYSIRKRIESWEKPAQLIYPGAKKGVLSQYDGFGNTQYMYAKNYLITGKTTLPKSKFNPAVVDSIKKMVEAEWSTKIPEDAGMFYFHWTGKKSPFLNKCWKKNPKMTDKNRESHCVEEYRKHLKWKATLVKTIPQYKTAYIPILLPFPPALPLPPVPILIPIPTKATKKGLPPYGTAYFFKSTRLP